MEKVETQDNEPAVEHSALAVLGEPAQQWVLLAGSGLSASSGVPQPFRTTRFSPSLVELVRHHVFRTQSRQLFHQLESALGEREAPLGYVADTLDEQAAWLQEQLADLAPHAPLLRVADLAKAGMFSAIVTNAPDRLLNEALHKVDAPFQEVTLEAAGVPEGASMPLLREWDIRVFRDTQDRRARENAFVEERMEAFLTNSTGVLVMGQTAEPSDLLNRLLTAVKRRPELRVVWVTEPEDGDEDTTVTDWLRQHHRRFSYLRAAELGKLLDDIAALRGVAPTPFVDKAAPETLLKRALNHTVDVRPILAFVPGVALLGSLIERMPRVSVKMFLSLFSLIAALVGWKNYGIWREYAEQIRPVKQHLRSAEESLAQGRGVARAEAELDDATRKTKRVILPYTSIFSIALLHTHIEEDFEDTTIALGSLRDLRITPRLYAQRLLATLRADPAVLTLSRHPPVEVIEGVLDDAEDPRGIRFRRKPLSAYRLPKALSSFREAPRVALYAKHAPLLRTIMMEEIIEEIEADKLALMLDLSRGGAGPLDLLLFRQVKQTAGYVQERASLFSADGITRALSEGRASLYVFDIEAGGVPQNAARVRELLARYPKARTVMAVHSSLGRRQLAEAAPDFRILSVAEPSWGHALAHLRRHTSAAFARDVMQDDYLRANIVSPLVLSLLADYHRSSGRVPASLAVVYDRLLNNMLERGHYGYAPKLRVLGDLAYRMTEDGKLTREEATRIISRILYRDGSLEKAAAVLDEIVGSGVMRLLHDSYVAFTDPSFQRLCVAKHLRELEPAERHAFLLRSDEEVIAFYAGLYPSVDPLINALLADVLTTHRRLQATGRHLSQVNPFAVSLRHIAVAAQNGDPSPAVMAQIESLLFSLAGHELPEMADDALGALQALSTPAVRRWVMAGIEAQAPYDHRLIAFTAKHSEAVFVPQVAGWLERVATAADRRADERFNYGMRQSPQGQASRFRTTLSAQTVTAISRALDSLAQVGTSDALNALLRFALPAKDPRFPDKSWQPVRQHAMRTLLWNAQPKLAKRFIGELEDNPGAWAEVVPDLYAINDAPTAELLGRLLLRDDKLDRETLKYKDHAALALGLMDGAVARPVVDKLLASPAAGADRPDFRPWAALALGYRGDAAELAKVAALVKSFDLERAMRHKKSASVLIRAVASFGDDKALDLFRQLYADERWRANGLNRDMPYQLHKLRLTEGAAFATEQLLCHAEPAQESVLITQLGLMRTIAARGVLERIVNMIESSDNDEWLKSICGDTTVPKGKLARWRGDNEDGRLASFVQALGHHHAPEALPLFARWAGHPDKAVRQNAIRILGRAYPDRSAGEAIAQSAAQFEDTLRESIYALGEQGIASNEAALLDLFAAQREHKSAIIAALGKSGELASLSLLLREQSQPKHGRAAARAALHIARRLIGRTLSPDALTGAI